MSLESTANGLENSIFERALAFTDDLPTRTSEAFEGLRFLYSPVLGMLFNVAQRLIEAKARGGGANPADEALILLCNRLFNEAFSGYVVLSRGLLGAGMIHLRSALEVTNLAVLFLLQPVHAERWLRGREYSPGDVRRLLNLSEEDRKWYGYLSKLSHANVDASATSVYPVGGRGAQVLFYGGHLAPRAAAANCIAFVWLALTFLRLFYARNSERLEQLELLWHPDVRGMLGEGREFTWERFFQAFADIVQHVQDEIVQLPEDAPRTESWASEIIEGWQGSGSE